MAKVMASRMEGKIARVGSGTVKTDQLDENFPPIPLPIQPPYPPQEAKPVAEIPSGPGGQYEPQWDGFLCLAFCHVLARSKAGQSRGQYFPEPVAALGARRKKKFLLDGETVIFLGGRLSCLLTGLVPLCEGVFPSDLGSSA